MNYLKITMAILVFWIIANNTYAQKDTIPTGGYLNYQEFTTQKPSVQVVANVQRLPEYKAIRGENEYKINIEGLVKDEKKGMRYGVYIYVFRDSAYINCRMQKMGINFALIRNRGKYLYCYAMTKNNTPVVGVGFGVAGVMATQMLTKLKLYVINPADGKAVKGDKFLEELLVNYPEQRKFYLAEKDKKDKAVLEKYLDEINAIEAKK